MEIEIKLSNKDEIQSLFDKCPEDATLAAKKALTKTAKTAKKTAISSTTKIYTAKRKTISGSLYVRRSYNDLISLIFAGPPLKMKDFSLRPNKPGKRPAEGLFLKVKRDGGGRLSKHFMAKMTSGHVGAFIRVDPDTKEKTRRLPISEGYGPSPPSMVKNPETLSNVEKESVKTFEEIFLREFDKRLARWSG